MKNKRVTIIFSTTMLVVLTASLLFGFWKTSSNKAENYTGIGSHVAISPDDQTILFPYYRDNKAGIYSAIPQGKSVEAITFPESGYDIRPQFSPNGTKIAYIHRTIGENDEPKQTLHIMDSNGGNSQQLTEEELFVSEAVFSSDGNLIYFLNAAVYTNYSPITGPRPHEYDIHVINLEDQKIEKLTNYKNYTMEDLTVSTDGESLYFQMMNDEKINEPSDTFEEYKEIFKLSLEDNQVTSFVPEGDFGVNEVYGMTFSKDEKLLAYSAVTSESANDSYYKYELFLTDMITDQTRQITDLRTYVQEPVFFHTKNQFLFIEQPNWPGKPEIHQLWKMNIDGTGIEKIEIDL